MAHFIRIIEFSLYLTFDDAGDLNIGLSEKLTETLSYRFLTSFRTHFSFSLRRLGAELEGVFRPPPQHIVENPDSQQGAG